MVGKEGFEEEIEEGLEGKVDLPTAEEAEGGGGREEGRAAAEGALKAAEEGARENVPELEETERAENPVTIGKWEAAADAAAETEGAVAPPAAVRGKSEKLL